MEIRHFLTFKTIVEEGSFVKAAQNLNYAQSSITSHIQAIEEYYGQPVFDRLGKRVQLNSFGAVVYRHCLPLLSCYDELCRLKHMDTEPSGKLRIGVPESTMLYRLSPVLQQYKSAYPGVEVVMQNLICPVMRQELRNGNLDVAVLLDRKVNDPDLVSRTLCAEPMSLVMPADYPGDKIAESSSHSFLYTEKGCSYREIFENILSSRGIIPASIIETASVEVIKQYVLCSIGVSFLPTIVVSEEVAKGELRHESWESPDPILVQIVYHKDKWLSPAMDEFIRMALEHASAW